MLKGISPLLSGELLKILCEMGHGDELVVGDGNFPAASHAKRLVALPGVGAVPLLDAILPLFPLDTFVQAPVCMMRVAEGDSYVPWIQQEFRRRIGGVGVQLLTREEFYERTARAYCVIATGERARYANLILKKGILEAPDED